ncbi:MAG TPA: DUF4340 domain-containing protein [Polyangiaceae bacterium]|jgi:hypothetical protein
MSRDKLIILGVLVLGLLGFLVYKQSEKDQAIGQPSVLAKDFPTISAPDDVDKLSIVNGDKGEVVLEKVADPGAAAAGDGGSGGVWRITKPMTAPANQQTVKDLVANLKELKVDSQINLKLDDEVRKDKQLDATHGVHVTAWKGGDKKVDETFGKSGQAGELVVLASQPEKVWAAKGYSSYLYTKEPKDYRDKEILKFDDGNAAQVTIVNTHGTLSFTKGDKWVGTFDKNPIANFSEDKVKDMLRAYKALNADDFGDGKSAADTGLDKPDATVSIVLKDGAGKYELLVGKTGTGADHYAKRSDSDTIFQIASGAAEWATSDGSKYAASPDAGAASDAGMKVSQRPTPKR